MRSSFPHKKPNVYRSLSPKSATNLWSLQIVVTLYIPPKNLCLCNKFPTPVAPFCLICSTNSDLPCISDIYYTFLLSFLGVQSQLKNTCISFKYSHFCSTLITTGWRRPTGSLIFISHFPKKSPIIGASFAENDLQLMASNESTPPCNDSFVCTRGHVYYSRESGGQNPPTTKKVHVQ